MKPKTVLVTGSTDGVGKETALEMAKLGWNVIIHGRNKDRILATSAYIQNKVPQANIDHITADFASLSEVKNMAEELRNKYPPLDVLINNAGVYMSEFELSEDHYEMTFAVNHLAHFLLTNLLPDSFFENPDARIINVSSMSHRPKSVDLDMLNEESFFKPYNAYNLSKLFNILFTFELSCRLKEKDITVNCLHPGVISSKLLHAALTIDGAPVNEGAKTSVYLATSDEIKNMSGKYFDNLRIANVSDRAKDPRLRKKLWELSLEYCKDFL